MYIGRWTTFLCTFFIHLVLNPVFKSEILRPSSDLPVCKISGTSVVTKSNTVVSILIYKQVSFIVRSCRFINPAYPVCIDVVLRP